MRQCAFALPLLLLPLLSVAQHSHTGILGGASFSQHSPSYAGKNVPVINGYVGAYRSISITPYLSIESGLYLTQRGARYEYDPQSGTVPVIPTAPRSTRTTLSYIMLPMVLQKNMDDFLSVHLGGYAAGLVHSWNKFTLTSGDEEHWYDWGIFTPYRNTYTHYDLGLRAGLRYLFTSHLVLNASYDHGLVGIMKRVINESPKNRSLSLSVGYQW